MFRSWSMLMNRQLKLAGVLSYSVFLHLWNFSLSPKNLYPELLPKSLWIMVPLFCRSYWGLSRTFNVCPKILFSNNLSTRLHIATVDRKLLGTRRMRTEGGKSGLLLITTQEPPAANGRRPIAEVNVDLDKHETVPTMSPYCWHTIFQHRSKRKCRSISR